MDKLALFEALGLALALGLLVGIQRERADSSMGGIRTFAILSLLGALSALLAGTFGGWVFGAGLLALAAILVASRLRSLKANNGGAGVTTEVAALTIFAVGGALVAGHTALAIVTAGVVAVLLQWKEPLHQLVRNFSDGEIRAIFQFALLALVILPLLPNQAYGPYAVLNPFKIWLIVVLIVGISLGAFLIYRFFGARAGTLLGGVLGGFISSTATTVSYARQSRDQPDAAALSAVVILIASSVVYVRILIEIAVTAPQLLLHTLIPLGAMLIFMLSLVGLMFLRLDKRQPAAQDGAAPSQIKAALVFGALYAFVLFLVAAAREHFGENAIYGVALISGLTDVDAITLSSAELFKAGRLSPATAWKAILLASLSNLVFKAGAVAVLGNRAVALKVGAAFGVTLAFGLGLLFVLDRLTPLSP